MTAAMAAARSARPGAGREEGASRAAAARCRAAEKDERGTEPALRVHRVHPPRLAVHREKSPQILSAAAATASWRRGAASGPSSARHVAAGFCKGEMTADTASGDRGIARANMKQVLWCITTFYDVLAQAASLGAITFLAGKINRS